MIYRSNMAYRAPASMDIMRMTKAQLTAAAKQGDAAAAAELARRKANAAEKKEMGGRFRTPEEEAARAASGSSAADGAAEVAAAAGQNATETTAAAAEGEATIRQAQTAQALARAAEEAAIAAAPAKEKKERKKAIDSYTRRRIEAERIFLGLRYKVSTEEALDLYRAGNWPPGRVAAKANPLPYPGARVLYPQQGLIQGGTGPFYGPTGTLFDKMPDLLWEYKSNPRMRGAEVLWPQPMSRVGPIQGGSQRYMSYPTAAPWDRMPNLTTKLNKKRSR